MEKEGIKVSIILPVYNVEQYLKQCLDSLINQTLKEIEIICVNDGSSDNSLAILNEYAKKDSRVIVIDQENQGPGVARNKGLDAARGEYIMFCDPDDWYELDACESAYNKIKSNNNDISFFGVNLYYDESQKIKRDSYRLKGFLYETNLNNIDLKTLTSMYIKTNEVWYKIYNLKFLKENDIRFSNTKLLEDCIFTIKALLNAKTVSVQFKPLYNYRVRKNSTSSLGVNYFEEIFYNRDLVLDYILKSPNKNTFLPPYISSCVGSTLYWYDKYLATDPSINKKFYNKMREHFIKLNNNYDCSQIKSYMKYQRFKKIIKTTYPKKFMKDLFKNTVKTVFEITNIKKENKTHKRITLLGVKFNFKKKTQIQKTTAKYEKVIKKIKSSKKTKLKVLFLVNEVAKWKTQSLYDLMEADEHFEPIIALTIADIQCKFSDEEKQKILRSNFEYFKKLNMKCVYAYDFENNEQTSLKQFEPDIVFYQQPWHIAKIQRVRKVAKYALTCYVPYYVPNYGVLPYECQDFHKHLYKYYVLNDEWAEIYKEYGKNFAGDVIGLGHTMLDRFYLKQYNKLPKDDYVIYAPHWSICDEKNPNKENCSTFHLNGCKILEYAKQHPEINWAFKPHPTLKNTLYKIGKMTPEEIENYYSEWEKFAYCSYSDYVDLFANSKALITDCCSFLVEYFVTEKPVLHLISQKNTLLTLEPSQKIFDTYYKIHNTDELYSTMDSVICKNIDTKKNKRINVLKELKLLNNYAAKNIINDLKSIIE